jgi:hypothetical protein
MKRRTVFFLLAVFLFSLSCQFLAPAREGTVISNCADIVATVRSIQPGEIPQHLFDTGIKQGNEFDANEYFNVLTHISMQDGYALDYVYPIPDLGGAPILYARAVDQAPYPSMDAVPENTQLPDFREYLQIEDMEQGYFEYVALNVMANQFYLFWHAQYNDMQIVCNSDQVNAIISNISDGSFGIPLDISGQVKARAMTNIEPVVQLTESNATVEVILFTKWGGFYRQTYTISRSFPHTIIDTKSENIVPYDCGIMF